MGAPYGVFLPIGLSFEFYDFIVSPGITTFLRSRVQDLDALRTRLSSFGVSSTT